MRKLPVTSNEKDHGELHPCSAYKLNGGWKRQLRWTAERGPERLILTAVVDQGLYDSVISIPVGFLE
jgi:hypothetical protein